MISLTTFTHILPALNDVIFNPFPANSTAKVFGELEERSEEWWISDSWLDC